MIPHAYSQPLLDGLSPVVGAPIQHAYFDQTIRDIRTLADVAMTDSEPAPVAPHVHLVLDTNVLLLHLDTVRQFVVDIEAQALPLQVIIPTAVLAELDSQKNRRDLAWFARRASAWILDRAREHRTVRGQQRDERLETSRPPDPERENDLLIADCAEFFSRRPGHTILCSGDKNLCTECEFRGVRTVLAPAHSEWSSRDLMCAMFPTFPDLAKFAMQQRAYRPSARVQGPKGPASVNGVLTTSATDVDGMEVDQEPAEVLLPSHALDSLHLQLVEHFRALLLDLVLRVGGAALPAPGSAAARSVHAPAYAGKPAGTWNAAECVEFLNTLRALPSSTPPLREFMALPYTARGARRGQDWSRHAWEQALGALHRLGESWGDGAIVESVSVLPYHCERIFAMPMRPTGM